MMSQCRFIDCTICTTLKKHVGNKEGYSCAGAWGTWEIPVLFTLFCCEPNIALKKITFEEVWSKKLTCSGKNSTSVIEIWLLRLLLSAMTEK